MENFRVRYISIAILFLIIGWIGNGIWENNKHNFVKPLDQENQSFDFFYTYFSTDSAFQREHVKLPLPYTVLYMGHNESSKEVLMERKYISLPAFLESTLYDNYDKKLTGKRRLLEIDNTFYFFEFQDDDWYLIKIEEHI